MPEQAGLEYAGRLLRRHGRRVLSQSRVNRLFILLSDVRELNTPVQPPRIPHLTIEVTGSDELQLAD